MTTTLDVSLGACRQRPMHGPSVQLVYPISDKRMHL